MFQAEESAYIIAKKQEARENMRSSKIIGSGSGLTDKARGL